MTPWHNIHSIRHFTDISKQEAPMLLNIKHNLTSMFHYLALS